MKNTNEFALHKVKTNKAYFEGWYYKIQTEDIIYSVIFGIHQNEKEKSAFIQMIDTIRKKTYHESFSWDEIKITNDPYELHFKNNRFSEHKLELNLDAIDFKLNIDFTNLTPIKKSLYMPTIMGPFSYIPMECIHSIISLHHQCKGFIQYKDSLINIDGIGYIEKDRGVSFPKKYVWFQSNKCEVSQSCFFISIATIPLPIRPFTGIICVLFIAKEQLRFATYLGCRLQYFDIYEYDGKRYVNIHLHQGVYCLKIRIEQSEGFALNAPIKGKMDVKIHEHLNSQAWIILYKNNKLKGCKHFIKGASEIVN